ncbi:O-antigen ligase family protein [candidate division WOR-3 bacterium]|nr:O-antigen ligase family protein [candidate division WOR-3 bacterium]
MILNRNKERKFEIILNTALLSFIFLLAVFNGSVTSFGPLILEISFLVLFGFYLYNFINKNFVLYRSKYAVILGLLAVWAGISAWLSSTPYGSFERWREWLAFFGLIFLSNQFLRDKLRIGYIEVFLMLFGSFQAAIGIVQFAAGFSTRASGTFGTYSNFYSHFLGVCLIASVHFFVKEKNLRTRNELLVLFLPIFMISTALLLSGARVIPFLIFPLAFMNRSWLKRIGIILTGAFFALMVFLLIKKIGGRDVFGSDPYHLTRLLIWKQSVFLVFMRPLFGFGPGSFHFSSLLNNFAQNFQIFRHGRYAEYAHNNYLEIAVEAGIPALIMFSIILFRSVKDSLRIPLKEAKSDFFSFAVLWLVLVGFFDTVFYPPLAEYLGAIFIGICLPRKEEQVSGRVGLKVKRRMFAVFAIYLIWVLSAFFSKILYMKATQDIQSGETERIVSSQNELQILSFIDPLNPDTDYIKSFVYEYYWIKSKNTLWLQKAYDHAQRSAEFERDYRRWKRVLALAREKGDSSQIYEAALEVALLEPKNASNLIDLAQFEVNGRTRDSLISEALKLEPRSIAVLEFAYRWDKVSESEVIIWNFDSLLSNSKNFQDTVFVSDFNYAMPISQKLFKRGYRDEALYFMKRIKPIYRHREDFIVSYATFLYSCQAQDEFSGFLDSIQTVEISPRAQDSLRRLRIVF